MGVSLVCCPIELAAISPVTEVPSVDDGPVTVVLLNATPDSLLLGNSWRSGTLRMSFESKGIYSGLAKIGKRTAEFLTQKGGDILVG